MSAGTVAPPGWRELDTRHTDGIDVALYWRESDGAVMLEVEDSRHPEESFTCASVAAESAAYAFAHPFAYLAEITRGQSWWSEPVSEVTR